MGPPSRALVPSKPQQQQPKELSLTEVLQQPSVTLAKILSTLDKFVDELNARADEGHISLKDYRALTDVVKAHATLRQTQLAEDAFNRQAQTLSTDADVAALLIEAVKAGGPEAAQLLREALDVIDAPATAPALPPKDSK